MSTESKAALWENVTAPPVILNHLLFGIVLGASLFQFHEHIFPPRLNSPNFWALSVIYVSVWLSWFGFHEAAQAYPITRTPVGKLRSGIESFAVVLWAYLLFAASRAADSLLGYLWGLALFFGIVVIGLYVRQREWHRHEAAYQSMSLTIEHGLIMLAAATAYSIWAIVFAPIPTPVIWIFVFVPLAITVSIRLPQYLRELPSGMPSE